MTGGVFGMTVGAGRMTGRAFGMTMAPLPVTLRGTLSLPVILRSTPYPVILRSTPYPVILRSTPSPVIVGSAPSPCHSEARLSPFLSF